ncbi:hypothetical protein CAP35_10990 [Chitinophagaceae bacterium IBVUCB1]|nr:hypothetical protein CAP35_10990 [Chitinophagaceae bacterium IBVUCB1]
MRGIAFVLLLTLIISCKKKSERKNYACTCISKSGNERTESMSIGKTSNEDAQKKCMAFKDSVLYKCSVLVTN